MQKRFNYAGKWVFCWQKFSIIFIYMVSLMCNHINTRISSEPSGEFVTLTSHIDPCLIVIPSFFFSYRGNVQFWVSDPPCAGGGAWRRSLEEELGGGVWCTLQKAEIWQAAFKPSCWGEDSSSITAEQTWLLMKPFKTKPWFKRWRNQVMVCEIQFKKRS